MDSFIEIDVFRKRLSDAAAWCSKQLKPGDPACSLRYTGLQPPGLALCPSLNIDLSDVVNAIAYERGRVVNHWNEHLRRLPYNLTNGKLLICTSATESIPDGGVTEMSKGFYDDDDMPPWDTWLCYLQEDEVGISGKVYQRQFLVSWVPPEFIELANIGVERHFLDCMHWATDEDTSFTRQIKAAGLLV